MDFSSYVAARIVLPHYQEMCDFTKYYSSIMDPTQKVKMTSLGNDQLESKAKKKGEQENGQANKTMLGMLGTATGI